MAVKAGPGPVFWVLAGILSLCTLTALWVTAARVKAQKLAARYGDSEEAPPPPSPEHALRRGIPARVGHFTLEFLKTGDVLEVRDAQDRPLARFPGLRKGQERGWQELRLSVLDAAPDELRVGAQFQPGSPCYGPGTYLALKTGLRIDPAQGRSITLLAWDPAKPEARLKVDVAGGSEEQTLADGETRGILGVTVSLRQSALDVAD